MHGDDRTDYPLADDPAITAAAKARESYARGWARSGGPMTERVKAGCSAAAHLAAGHPHDPGILEVALRLGSLEGTWAKVYQRREQVIAKYVAKANAAWKTVLTRDQLAGAVTDFRRRAGLLEADAAASASGQDDEARQKQLAVDALAAAAAMLQLLPDRPEWRSLRQAVRDALAAGQGEGTVGAIAISAEQVGRSGLDWGLAFDDAYAALDNLDSLWSQADGWLERMLGRATTDLGRALATAARDEATYAQTLAAAMDALDSEDVDAVSFIVDWASTEALRQGALDLYTSEGVVEVSWLDAGDTRVCVTCDSNAANSPYSPGDYPDLPHPGCRCSPAAAVSLANYAAWFTGS